MGTEFFAGRSRPSSAVPHDAGSVRRNLEVGAHDDPAEREADRLAERVTQRLQDRHLDARNSAVATTSSGRAVRSSVARASVREAELGDVGGDIGPRIHRRTEPTSEIAPIVGAEGGQLDPATERDIGDARTGGQRLEPRIQRRMESAFGTDLSAVRMHIGGPADELSQRIQARAFTAGNDIFIPSREYEPDTRSGQTLLAHELAHTVQQSTTVSRKLDPVIRRYADIPDHATWKQDSNIARTRRSKELKAIDEAVAEYDKVKDGDELALKRSHMILVLDHIRQWEKIKTPAGVAKSDRAASIMDLKQVFETKVQENLAAHASELDPVAADYHQAVANRDMAATRRVGAELSSAHHEFFSQTAADALKTKDPQEWATAFFSAPFDEFGINPFTVMSLKRFADFSWLRREHADIMVNDYILPGIESNKNALVQMLQYPPFRNGLLTRASPAATRCLLEMPLVRMTVAAESDAATKNGGAPSVEEMADSVFAAFLGDQPVSGLGYATNSANFSTGEFLLGSSTTAKRAPCMTLSNMLTEVFRAVLPNGNPASQVMQRQDMVPMLTKPLHTIGTGNGILTQETSFSGNVEQYGDVKGHANINRIFFGDGHEWLQVGNKEYDPTLGITGPVGTVKACVEAITFTKKGEKYKGSDGTTATRNKHVPPGGGPLLFQRSVVIN